MKLTDREVLELNELCGAVVDGTLSDRQRARLEALLRQSEAARRYYVRMLGQSASLHGYAAEMHAEAPDRPVRPRAAVVVARWTLVGLAAAAAVVFAIRWSRPMPPAIPGITRGADTVASVTALKDARWASNADGLTAGAYLKKGQHLDLQAGFAEITFDSGARVVIEGGTSFDVNSAWDGSLRRGALKATVPPEAIGFRITNPAVDVVDLGTEFTMIADAGGAADVMVLKGEVEASPGASNDDDTVLLREKEARRFDASGISAVNDTEARFARFTRPIALDRFAPRLGYVHWPLDERSGGAARAEVSAATFGAGDPHFQLCDVPADSDPHVAGHFGRALRFDGRMYAKAHVTGMSGAAPRTVAFWVRVPNDAQPIDTWMVAWGTKLKKLGNRPVQISWNRRPAEGALGALRTDFGGGYAIGTTSLRDGQWHYITVYFAPGDDSSAAPEVKQYVDGRLESSTIVPGTVHAPAGTGEMAIADTVWLGYRLTGKQEGRRFHGDLDELFIADRGLEPKEIVALMRDNRISISGLALNR